MLRKVRLVLVAGLSLESRVMLARLHKNEGTGCGPSRWAEVFAKEAWSLSRVGTR